MRRLAAVAGAVAIVTACASIQQPPGGPLRTVPPVLLTVTPDSGAVNVAADKVVFTFDEVINDRPSGTSLLENVFVVSPVHGSADVDWKRSRIEVKPHGGFQPGVAYSVTMLPGIQDQRNNILKTSRTVVFSTGPEIPPYTIDGRVFDWMRQSVAGHALVQAIRADSLTWLAVADSTGQFSIGPMPQGDYLVRAIIDANQNRALDRLESFDTVTVGLHDTLPFLELLAAPRDTNPARIASVVAEDSVAIAVTFDRPLGARALDTAAYRVQGPDSSARRVIRVLPRSTWQAARDSAQRDSAARADTSGLAAAARTAAAIPARRDTSLRGIRPSRPAPPTDVIVLVDPTTPLQPGTQYRLTAVQARSITGVAATSDREFTYTPKPATPARPAPASPARPAARPPGA